MSRMVKATSAPGTSVALIAGANGVNANRIFAWRRLYREGKLGQSSDSSLLPVRWTAEAGNAGDSAAAAHDCKGVIL